MCDVLVLALCSFFAIFLSYDFGKVPTEYIEVIKNFLIIDIIVMLIIFIANKLYVSIWTYASINELLNVFLSCISFIALDFMYKVLFDIILPKSYYVIKGILLVLLVSFVRYAYRILRTVKSNIRNKKESINTMIVGAGEAGRLLITEINNNPTNFGNRIMCVIDDDKNNRRNYIRNIPIVGDTDGFNFQLPKQDNFRYTPESPYIGKGSNRDVKLGKE